MWLLFLWKRKTKIGKGLDKVIVGGRWSGSESQFDQASQERAF